MALELNLTDLNWRFQPNASDRTSATRRSLNSERLPNMGK